MKKKLLFSYFFAINNILIPKIILPLNVKTLIMSYL